MPRNSSKKYTAAFDAIITASDHLRVEPSVVSRVLIREINRNRIRMRGHLIDHVGKREPLPMRLPADLVPVPSKQIPLNLFKTGLHVIPSLYAPKYGLRGLSLCDVMSNIFIGPVGSSRFTKVIVQAELLNSGFDKIMRETFAWSGVGAATGVRRNERVWGEVILHLLNLQKDNRLTLFRTTEALVKSVIDTVDGIDPNSVRHILDYIVRRLNQRREKEVDQ